MRSELRRTLPHIAELDGIRALAALWVFCVHCMMSASMPPDNELNIGWRLARWIFSGGSYGVNVFFVLSGFLITSLLLLDRDKPRMLHDFYWKRVLRIQPVFLLYLVATWFLLPDSHGYVLLSLFFVVNLSHQANEAGPAWTLAIEEQFYLIWPQVVKRCPLRAVGTIAVFTFVGTVLLRTVFYAVTGHINVKYTPYELDGLALGALLAVQYMAPDTESTGVRRFLRVLHSRMVMGCVFLLAFVVASPVVLPHRLLTPAILVTNMMSYYAIRFMVFHPESVVFGWLRSRILLGMGNISYSFYLFHGIVLVSWNRLGPGTVFGTAGYVGKFMACLTISCCICSLLRWCVELPTQRLRRYVLKPSVEATPARA